MFLTDSDFYTEGAFSYQGLWSQKTLGLKNRFTKDKVRKRIKTVLVEAVLKRKNKQTKNWNSLKIIRITFPPSSWKRTSTNDFLKKFKLNWKWQTSLFWAQIMLMVSSSSENMMTRILVRNISLVFWVFSWNQN